MRNDWINIIPVGERGLFMFPDFIGPFGQLIQKIGN
jgi:hypothetical protein